MNLNHIVLYAGEGCDPQAAKQLAEKLNIVMTEALEAAKAYPLMLKMDDSGLSLVGQDGTSFQGDLRPMIRRLKGGVLYHEMLVKAAKIKDLSRQALAIDATAGMGEDSLLLAAAGFEVHLFEYNSVIAALLQDTLRRALEIPELTAAVSRMHVHEGDSTKLLPAFGRPVDMVLLDPMFPARTKSALIKKKFQLLQQLEQPCSSEEELLEAALSVKPFKIVVKRPLKGPILGNMKPSYAVEGKAIRYDCLVFPENLRRTGS